MTSPAATLQSAIGELKQPPAQPSALIPIMGQRHLDAILAAIKPGARMLEWGCGGSTAYFARHLPRGASLLSIEHDPAWHQRVSDVIGRESPGAAVTLMCTPAKGPLGANATPDEERDQHLQDFVHAADGQRFDVILVDGYARGACMARCRDLLNPGGVVFLHDAQRPWYDDAKQLLHDREHLGSCPEYPGPQLWCGDAEELTAMPNAASTVNLDALPLIVCFYTEGTPYEHEARRLRTSCERLGLAHDIRGVPPFGRWEFACAYKARFVSEAWYRHRRSILWVDADAVIRQRPDLLSGCDADFAICKFGGSIMASGTVFFNHTPLAEDLLARWRRKCTERPDVWDQITLDQAWEEMVRDRPLKTRWLPETYCAIVDAVGAEHATGHSAPVIEQFQASRRLKSSVGAVSVSQASPPNALKARRASRDRTPEELHEDTGRADAPAPHAGPAGVELRALHGELAELQRRVAELSRDRDTRLSDAANLRWRLADNVAIDLERRGLRRIALFGAGRHTPAIIREPWRSRGISVVAVLDDRPAIKALSGVPVCTPADLHEPIDAVVLSSDAHEPALFASASAYFGSRGVPVLRIYGEGPSMADPASTVQRLVEQFAISDLDAQWLVANGAERHDASLPMLPPHRTEAHLRRYELAATFVRGRAVLDVASGTGYGAAMLLQAGARSVLGVELDARAVDYAARRFARPGMPLKYVQGEATRLPAPDASIDVLASFETIEHVQHPEQMLTEVGRVLRPDGVLVLSTPNEWGVTDHHEHSFSRDSLGQLLLGRFDLVRWIGQRAAIDPRSAALPPGMYDLNDLAPQPEWLIVIAQHPRG